MHLRSAIAIHRSGGGKAVRRFIFGETKPDRCPFPTPHRLRDWDTLIVVVVLEVKCRSKMLKSFLVAGFLLLGAAYALPKNDCGKGPSYWCRDHKTAIKCGVLSFCKAMEPKEDNKIRFRPSSTKKSVADAPPVNVSFYYESLCPGCREVWRSQLLPTFTKPSGHEMSFQTSQFDLV